MTRSGKYPREIRGRAVRMVLEIGAVMTDREAQVAK
jgi:transposase-like protein